MRVLPSPRATRRVEETLPWTACLESTDGKIAGEGPWRTFVRPAAGRDHPGSNEGVY